MDTDNMVSGMDQADGFPAGARAYQKSVGPGVNDFILVDYPTTQTLLAGAQALGLHIVPGQIVGIRVRTGTVCSFFPQNVGLVTEKEETMSESRDQHPNFPAGSYARSAQGDRILIVDVQTADRLKAALLDEAGYSVPTTNIVGIEVSSGGSGDGPVSSLTPEARPITTKES